MKKILIIRSANMWVAEKLIDYINKKYNNEKVEIYLLIQRSSVKQFIEKYPNINYIEKEDGFFCYSNFRKSKELNLKLQQFNFDEIYIPSSDTNFDGFDETFLIASSIKTNKYILFNCNSETKKIKLNIVNLFLNKYFSKLIYLVKVIIALITISSIYIVYYPYCKIRKSIEK